MVVFRKASPSGRNVVVAGNVFETRHQRVGPPEVTFCSPAGLPAVMSEWT